MMITAVEATGNDPEPTPDPEPMEGTYTLINSIDQVKTGTYYMAGYAPEYNNQGNITNFAPYSYHMWTGGINNGSSGSDLMTVNYSYTNGVLQLNPDLSAQDAAKGTAQLVELVAVNGKANTYYIKFGEKYLTCTGKRAAALVDSPVEWAFSAHPKGGICLTDNNVILGTAGATYNLLRCYVSPASSLLYGVVFFTPGEGTATPDPTPDPTPTPGESVAINTITSAGTYTATGTVVAIGTQAYIIADNTGAMMVYHTNHGRTIGENITISGDVTIYQKTDGTSWGTPQFSNTATVVVNSTGNNWTYNPTILSADGIDEMMTQTVSKEVQFTGTLVVDGNYINITFDETNTQGSIKYVDNNAYSSLNGQTVTVKGYFVGVSSNKFVNVLPYAIEGQGGVTPNPNPDPTPDPEPDPTPGQYTSVADFLAAPEDETTLYTLKGTITAVANSEYGNFDLTDQTGTVLIYGLNSPDGTTNKYWAASGAKLGDDIVVKTVRSSYGSTPQGKNAHFVEVITPGTIPFWSFEKTIVSFLSEGGEQKVNVTTKDAAWTATVEGEGFTVSPESGAAGVTTEVTVTAAANTLGSRSATITFTTATGKSKTVSVQQGASPTSATIREFATEYVKLIDIWKKNVGVVNTSAGIGAQGNELDVENAHYVPDDTTIKLGDIVYNLADAVELASRSYLLLRGYDGNNTTTYGRNLPIPKIEKAYTMDNNLPETHSYTWGSYPYAEPTNGGWFRMVTAEGEFELMKVDILDDYSHRHTNYPGQGGALSNFCGYTGDYLPGYTGCCCVKRIMLAYAYFFKYMLDNNLSDATGISPDQTFEAPLFGENEVAPTIKAFATEYVKFIDIWEKTTGTVNYMHPTALVTEGWSYDGVANIENGHYIPFDTKLTVAGVEYSTSEVFDIALRSYLLLRGIDATDETAVGAGAFSKLEKAYTMDDNFLPARAITWGSAPCNETGTTAEDGAVSGNGGPLKMGTPPNGENKVKVDLLDNFAERNANFPPVKNGNQIGNMAGYTNRLAGYYGCASGHRMLLTYAYFFKYMLDNNLSDATAIPADQTFESYHFTK